MFHQWRLGQVSLWYPKVLSSVIAQSAATTSFPSEGSARTRNEFFYQAKRRYCGDPLLSPPTSDTTKSVFAVTPTSKQLLLHTLAFLREQMLHRNKFGTAAAIHQLHMRALQACSAEPESMRMEPPPPRGLPPDNTWTKKCHHHRAFAG